MSLHCFRAEYDLIEIKRYTFKITLNREDNCTIKVQRRWMQAGDFKYNTFLCSTVGNKMEFDLWRLCVHAARSSLSHYFSSRYVDAPWCCALHRATVRWPDRNQFSDENSYLKFNSSVLQRLTYDTVGISRKWSTSSLKRVVGTQELRGSLIYLATINEM